MALNKMELIKCEGSLVYIDLNDVIDIIKVKDEEYTIIFNDGTTINNAFVSKRLYNKFLNQKHIDKKSRI